jgi:hypothetical protein
MARIATLLLVSFTLATFSVAGAQEARPTCEPGVTQAIVEIRRVSDFYACGTAGRTEVAIRFRVVRRLTGPDLGRGFVGIWPCAPIQLAVGDRWDMCVGATPPNIGALSIRRFCDRHTPARVRAASPRLGISRDSRARSHRSASLTTVTTASDGSPVDEQGFGPLGHRGMRTSSRR